MLKERNELLPSAAMAASVLNAWQFGGWNKLTTQLEQVSARCREIHPSDADESERMELLEGVIEFLRTDMSADRFYARQLPVRVHTGLRLLKHLAWHVRS
jgi:hypothetical protein